MRFVVVALWACLMSCAADLPRERRVKTALPVELVDLSKVFLTDAITGEEVNVANYMEEHNLDYTLLMFGSVGCSKCNEKALNLSKNYFPKHQLFLEKEARHFDMIGVNTDTGSALTKFQGIMLDADQREAHGYSFVKWSDPKGEKMMEFFAEKGDRFGVPFTVLLTRKGILWRYNNKQPYSVEDLVERVVDTMNGDATSSKPSSDEGTHVGPLPGNFALLNFETPYRFEQMKAKTCAGTDVKIQKALAGVDFLFVQVSKDDCKPGSVCASNLNHLSAAKGVCAAKGKKCGAVHFSIPKAQASACARSDIDVVQGGSDFFDVFATHFNWRYDPITDGMGVPTSIPAVQGPLVFTFRKDGMLVQSWEGLLPNAEQGQSLEGAAATAMNQRASGIDYGVFGDPSNRAPASTNLAAIRKDAKYTVVAGFDRYCGSCVEELAYWSQAGQVRDFCARSGGFCQVVALEGELAQTNTPDGRRAFFREIKDDIFAPNNVSVPLLIDESQFGDGFGRIFESYFTPMYPQWGGVYGSVIYDREGKIIAQFKSQGAHTEDPVLGTLKILKNLP